MTKRKPTVLPAGPGSVVPSLLRMRVTSPSAKQWLNKLAPRPGKKEPRSAGKNSGRPSRPRSVSALEQALARQITEAGLPDPVPEHRFDPTRRWRFDFAWLPDKVAVEVEGGSWINGRHSRGKGFAADCEKYNCAQVQGWLVLRVTDQHIRSGEALDWIEEVLGSN